ncbi:DUF6777 domain-containing protein [Streptomyces sp. NPDC051018]|uniref:DUF6777 domain-containing protein n=1 Tax=Streptomyces sp. NPDC051018 TaxID=3365639 RepID=UPI00379EAB28
MMKRREMVVRPMRRRWSVRRRWSAAAALSTTLSLGFLVAGCGGDGVAATDKDEEVLLQPAADKGPDPYTATTVRELSAPAPRDVLPPPPPGGPPVRGQILRTLSGATPGLYGGIQSVGSCDIEQQITLLRAEPAKARAFARGAGVSQGSLPGFLRDLTPVVLRADTRVTSHGYRKGSAASRQAVLQAGTAVLVDRHGSPRVRCACGNPLRSPAAVKGGVIQQGRPWDGYRPDRVVVVKPTPQVMSSLVIVDVSSERWVERQTGSDGERDRRPDVLPPVNPDDIYSYPVPSEPGDTTGTSEPERSTGPADPAPSDCPDPSAPVPGDPDSLPPPPGCPTDPYDTAPSVEPVDPGRPPADPRLPPDADVYPADPDLIVPSEQSAEPDTFAG